MALALKGPAFDDRLIALHNQWWPTIAGTLAALLGAAIVAIIVLALRPSSYMGVLEVTAGKPTGLIEPIHSVQTLPDAIVQGQLGNFLHAAFTVSNNDGEESYQLELAKSMLTGQAFTALRDWYHIDQNNPRKVALQAWQEVVVVDTVKLPPSNLYSAHYQLIRHDLEQSNRITTTNWWATMHTTLCNSQNAATYNICIDSLTFGKVGQ